MVLHLSARLSSPSDTRPPWVETSESTKHFVGTSQIELLLESGQSLVLPPRNMVVVSLLRYGRVSTMRRWAAEEATRLATVITPHGTKFGTKEPQ